MSYIVSADQMRALLLGVRVKRAATTLPQSAQVPLFKVVGGRAVVTALIGRVTVATGATATNGSIIASPEAGTATTVAAAASIASKEVGSHIAVSGAFGSGLLTSSTAGAAGLASAPFLAGPCTIDLLTSASNTGQVEWTICYIPLDDGVTVVVQ